MPDPRPLRGVSARLALLALLAAPAAAQDAQGVDPPVVADVFEVRVVNVDVFVTDRRGRPITGLTRDDFRLFEDDREVEIRHFYALDGTSAAAEDGAAPPAAPQELSATTVVVYVDDTGLLATRRDLLLSRLHELTGRPELGELTFDVVVFDGGLSDETGMTRDFAEVEAALERLAGRPPRGLERAATYRRARQSILDTYESYAASSAGARGVGCGPCECGLQDMLGSWETYARAAIEPARRSVAALGAVVEQLGRLPGRKILVQVSSPLVQRPGVSLADLLAGLCSGPSGSVEYVAGFYGRYDVSADLERVAALANTGRVTLYPLASDGGLGADAREGGDGLELLASATGGRRLYEVADLADTVATDLVASYSLGFTPDHPTAGAVHTLRVELRDPPRGTRLRHRRSWVDVPVALP